MPPSAACASAMAEAAASSAVSQPDAVAARPVEVDQGEPRAGRRVAFGERRAQATRGAGDDDDAIVQNANIGHAQAGWVALARRAAHQKSNTSAEVLRGT